MLSPLRTRLPVVIPALVIALIALGLGAMAPRAAVGNAPLMINSTFDGYNPGGFGCTANLCTLRDAITAANQQAGPDTITIDPNLGSFDVQSALPMIDGSQGITFEGTNHTIDSQPAGQVLFGPVVFSDIGATIHDVTINHLTVAYFGYDGLQVCAGIDTDNGTCISEVSGVTMNDVHSVGNAQSGIRILGGRVDNVILQNINSVSNGANGVTIQSSEDLSGIQLTGAEIDENGAAGVDISGYPASDISISGGATYANGGDGFLLTADSLSGLDVQSLTADRNGGQNIEVNTTGSFSNFTVAASELTSAHTVGLSANAGSISNGLIAGNDINNNGFSALQLIADSAIDDIKVEENTMAGNNGPAVFFDAPRGTGSVVNVNTITNNSSGVWVSGEAAQASLDVTISRNSIAQTSHGLGIDLIVHDDPDTNGVTLNDDGDADVGPNGLLNYPVIANVTPQAANGTACANCLVELFVADPDPTGYGEGKTFIADATADGAGNFSVPICGSGLTSGAYVTATATDSLGETSEFSYDALLLGNAGACVGTPTPTLSPSPTPTATPVGQTPTPTPTPSGPTATPIHGSHKQGDLNCDGSVTANDALRPIRFSAGIPLSQPGGCPALDEGDPDFADVNCDRNIGPGDTVAILEHAEGVPIEPPQLGGCTPLGQLLPS